MPELSIPDYRACQSCKYSKLVRAQDGWFFRGCFKAPLKGKMVSEIAECSEREIIKKQLSEEKDEEMLF